MVKGHAKETHLVASFSPYCDTLNNRVGSGPCAPPAHVCYVCQELGTRVEPRGKRRRMAFSGVASRRLFQHSKPASKTGEDGSALNSIAHSKVMPKTLIRN